MGLSELCLEDGDLMSMSLTLSPAENNPEMLCISAKFSINSRFCNILYVSFSNRFNAHTVVFQIHSAAC